MLLWRSHDSNGAHWLPRGFLSMSPPFRNDALPLESIALLPGSSGSQGLLQHIAANPACAQGNGVGLFLGDPFLNLEQITQQLKKLEVQWICNLPSMAQHAEEFRNQLADVDISVAGELKALHEFRLHGFHTLAGLSSTDHLHTLVSHPADAILVLQTTDDLQISFPSLPQRLKKVTEIAAIAMIDKCKVLPVVTESELPQLSSNAVLRPVWVTED